MQNNKGDVCGCGHHSIIPILTILFGTTFLLGYQGILAPGSVDIIWPILVGIAGISKLMEEKCGCC